jgi:hypothetical protein
VVVQFFDESHVGGVRDNRLSRHENPGFRSVPTSLSPSQEEARTVIVQQLDDNDLEPRALGASDYRTELPLREVLLIARHCSGGIILGFEQFPR